MNDDAATNDPEDDATFRKFTAAYADAAALMVAASSDPDGLDAALRAMVDGRRLPDLAMTLAAAVELGGALIRQEEAREGQPGPVQQYLQAVSRHASVGPRR